MKTLPSLLHYLNFPQPTERAVWEAPMLPRLMLVSALPLRALDWAVLALQTLLRDTFPAASQEEEEAFRDTVEVLRCEEALHREALEASPQNGGPHVEVAECMVWAALC